MPAATQLQPPPSSAPSSPGGGKKFSTIAGSFGPFGSSGAGSAAAKTSSGSNATSNRPSSKNIFGDATATANKLGLDAGSLLGGHIDGGDRSAAAAAALAPGGRSRHSTVVPQDGPWSVSVAEAKDDDDVEGADAQQQQQRSGRKAATKKKTSKSSTSSQSYTIYVTTPTHNLTLQRSTGDIVEMDTRLREGNAAGAASLPRMPTLAPVPASTSSRKILKTLSRTLSPGGSRSRVALSHLTGSFGGNDSQTPTAKSSPTFKPGSRDGATSPPPAGALSGNGVNAATAAADEKTTHALASYFTTLSNLPAVRKHKAWKRFVRVRTDDLESVRVERRVHRVRSDLASHIKSVVAPTNTNVGAGPSQSDIGEDGGRTEDEREAASLSGRSGSRHSWGHSSSQMLRPGSSRSSTDRPDVPARSTSVEGTPGSSGGGGGGSATNGVAGNRSSPNFANIPEEVERERESSMTSLHPERGASTGTTTGATTTSGGDSGAAATTAGAADTSMDSSAIVKRKKRRQHREPEKVTVDDFEMIRVLGKGCAGKVLLVRHRPTSGLFAMKSIHKRHVLAHQELQHTLTEQAVLKRMARDVQDPFVVKLWWSFHDRTNLYLVMDFHPGGDLATQLSRWGRLGRDRARFYAAEIVEGVEGLHKAGVIYRDLKPENVLIGADGHIVLSDFGLSKEFPARDGPDGIKGIGGSGSGQSTPPGTPPRSASSRDLTRTAAARRSPHWMSASEDAGAQSATEGGNGASPANRSRNRWAADERDTTTTFCGTAEYLAPEVIQGSAYSYEVDWWSFGTMLYEMLTGITPFWADTHADMYVRVLHDELVFPDDRVLDMDTKSILRGLLQRNPMLRMKEPRIKKHPYFSMIEWAHVFHKRYIPPYIPPIDPSNAMDTQNFDEAFLDMQPVVNGDDEDEDMPAPSADGQTSSSKKSGKSGSAATGAAGSAVDGKSSAAGTGSNQASPVKSKGGNSEAAASKSSRPVAADGKSLFDGYSFRGRKDSGSIHSTAYSESLEAVGTAGANDDAAANAAVDGGTAGQETKPAVAASTTAAAPAAAPIAEVATGPASQPPRQPPATGSSQTSNSSMPSLLNALAPTPAASYLKQQQMRAAAQQQTQAHAQAQAQLKPVTPPTRTTSIPVTETASASSPAAAAAPSGKKKDDSDSEDDETAARNAVLALAALEREADEEEASMRSGGSIGVAGAAAATTSAKPKQRAIAETDGEGDDERDDSSSTTSSSSSSSSDGDAGEEEWDLLDLGTGMAAGSLGALPSEANGGKGQNLFARGVVDTYRLLRRQDSTRLTPSASGATLDGASSNSGGASGVGVGSGRPFSRLTTRQRQRNAATAALNGANGAKATTTTTTGGSNKGLPPAPSATSIVSSESRNAPAAAAAADMTPSSSTMLTVPGASVGGVKAIVKTTSRPSSSEEPDLQQAHAKGGSGEASGGGGAGGGVGMSKSSSSRIKRRFTTFFEQAGR